MYWAERSTPSVAAVLAEATRRMPAPGAAAPDHCTSRSASPVLGAAQVARVGAVDDDLRAPGAAGRNAGGTGPRRPRGIRVRPTMAMLTPLPSMPVPVERVEVVDGGEVRRAPGGVPGAGPRRKPGFWAGRGRSCRETTPATTAARSAGWPGPGRCPGAVAPSSRKRRMGVRKARSTWATVPEKVTERRPAATSSTRNPLAPEPGGDPLQVLRGRGRSAPRTAPG